VNVFAKIYFYFQFVDPPFKRNTGCSELWVKYYTPDPKKFGCWVLGDVPFEIDRKDAKCRLSKPSIVLCRRYDAYKFAEV